MIIERMYVGTSTTSTTTNGWEEIDEAEFVRRTEWAGYWKAGTALQALRDVGEIRTPFAFYRVRAVEVLLA